MTTLAALRTTYVNNYLGRKAADTIPWTDSTPPLSIDQATTDALAQLWPTVGNYVTGTVATNQNTDRFTLPGAIAKVSRIDVERVSGGVTQIIDTITNWRAYPGGLVILSPRVGTDSTLSFRVFGWAPFSLTGSDLPAELESIVAMKSAALCYGMLVGWLANAKNQQSLDTARVVDYQTAVGASAYWERRYQDAIDSSRYLVNVAPRLARR